MNFGPWDHMWNDGGSWMVGGSMMLAWLGLIAVAVWLVARSAAHTSQYRARDLLEERYARGEISTEEYQDRLAHLS